MTDPAPELPPWVQPYEPDFRELLRQLDLVPGFIFQPVVLPSPDLASALAGWLARQGVAVHIFDMRQVPWTDLALRLRTLTFEPSAERRAVVVITPHALDRATIDDGLAAFNFSRDSIARNLQCPLLWCGDVDLLRTTAELATDFWSIAATVYRIPLRALSDAPSGLMQAWWTNAVRETFESITLRIEHARRRGDMHAVAQASLDLAEAQLAHGERSEAFRTLSEVEGIIRADVPSLALRWRALHALFNTWGTTAPNVYTALRRMIADAHARKAVDIEAALYEELAQQYFDGNHSADAAESYRAARALYLDSGDESSALEVESRMVARVFPHLSPEDIAEIRVHAERMIRGLSSKRARGQAWYTLAELAYHQQRWDEADEAASVALHEMDPEEPQHLLAIGLREDIARLRHDWEAAVAHNTEILDFSLSHGSLVSAMHSYGLRAVCHSVLGHHKNEYRDIHAARELAGRLGVRDAETRWTFELARVARHLDAYEVHDALLPRAIESALRAESPVPPQALERAREDRAIVDILDTCTDDNAMRTHAINQIASLADARDRALRDRGINIFDVDTWPLTASPDKGRES